MRVIGLISGTSADGIDAALCEIDGLPPDVHVKILHGETIPYDDALRHRLLAPKDLDAQDICRLNVDLGEAFAAAAQTVMDDAALIGSHGQTIWHDVQDDGRVYATLQLGEAAIIAERTGLTTVSDFRPRDVAAGGQGAPLTAYADWLLLRHPSRTRAVQNIGGIANVTYLPPLSESDALPLAFDTGPGNSAIDAAVTLLTQGTYTYDQDGKRATRGTVREFWLELLLRDSYYEQPPPKSTGRERFGFDWVANLIQAFRYNRQDGFDLIATLTALTAHTIADAYRRFLPRLPDEMIVGGGGAHNPTLMRMLREMLPEVDILSHEEVGMDSDFKEAMVFALLAYLTLHGLPGTLPGLTGADYAAILGQITPGRGFHVHWD